MLVLTRNVGEKIILDNGVAFTVNLVRGKRVQVGIEAPKNVKILRGEIAEQKSEDKQQGPSNCKVDGVGPESMPTSGLPLT